MQPSRVHVRLLIIAGVAFLWMGAVFGRLTYLQLYRHSGEHLSRAMRQQQRTIEITPERGTILFLLIVLWNAIHSSRGYSTHANSLSTPVDVQESGRSFAHGPARRGKQGFPRGSAKLRGISLSDYVREVTVPQAEVLAVRTDARNDPRGATRVLERPQFPDTAHGINSVRDFSDRSFLRPICRIFATASLSRSLLDKSRAIAAHAAARPRPRRADWPDSSLGFFGTLPRDSVALHLALSFPSSRRIGMISSKLADPFATIPSMMNRYLLGRWPMWRYINVTPITAT